MIRQLYSPTTAETPVKNENVNVKYPSVNYSALLINHPSSIIYPGTSVQDLVQNLEVMLLLCDIVKTKKKKTLSLQWATMQLFVVVTNM